MMRTVYGWQCATGITEFSERSIRNWPIQSTCADIFRLAYVWGTRHGLTLIAPVHDAVLLEAPEDRIEADVALMREIMRRASRVILNPTRQDRPLPGSLHRSPWHGAMGHRAQVAGRAAGAGADG